MEYPRMNPAEIKSILNLVTELEARLLLLLNESTEETQSGEPNHDAVVWTSSDTGLPEQDLVHTVTGQ